MNPSCKRKTFRQSRSDTRTCVRFATTTLDNQFHKLHKKYRVKYGTYCEIKATIYS